MSYDERLRFALGIVLIVGVFVTIGALLYIDPEGYRDLVSYLITSVIGAGAIMVIQWHFGSSQGSNEKSKTLDKIASTSTTEGPKP